MPKLKVQTWRLQNANLIFFLIVHIIHFQRNWTTTPKGFVLHNGGVLHLKPPNHAPRASKQNKLQGYTIQAWRLELLQPLKFKVQVHCSQSQCTWHTTPKSIILHHVRKKKVRYKPWKYPNSIHIYILQIVASLNEYNLHLKRANWRLRFWSLNIKIYLPSLATMSNLGKFPWLNCNIVWKIF
jgi:hypothetical protein